MRIIRQLLPAIVLLAGFCDSGSPVSAADPPTITEIATGMRHREAQVKRLHMRFQVQITRTDFHLRQTELQWEQLSRESGRKQIPPSEPRAETRIYELDEQLPRRRWSQFAGDGSLVIRMAFDGVDQRQYSEKGPHGGRALLSRQNAPPALSVIRPESLERVADLPLADLLLAPESHAKITSMREVNGEQLVDLELVQGLPVVEKSMESWKQRIRTTINASRDYWPIFLRSEFVESSSAGPNWATEIEATGWIEAGPLVYPRQIEQRTFSALPRKPGIPVGDNTSPRLELNAVQRADILEVAVNADVPAVNFAPQFPAGEVYYDQRDRKFVEVDPAGQTIPYIPRPRGLRGAVFAYHLCWLTALSAYLILRGRRVPAD